MNESSRGKRGRAGINRRERGVKDGKMTVKRAESYMVRRERIQRE